VCVCVCVRACCGRLTRTSIQFGPSVGSKALTLGQAIMLAFVVECAGAVITGRDVVGTLPSHLPPPPSHRPAVPLGTSLSLSPSPPPRARHATPPPQDKDWRGEEEGGGGGGGGGTALTVGG
jgi:hypothetical protein